MTAKTKVRAFYNSVRASYDVTYDPRGPVYPANLFRMRLALRTLERVRACDVLDVGCGTGLVSAEMVQKGLHIWGIDFADNALAIARKRMIKLGYPPERFRLGDVERLPYRPGSFDAAVALGVFPHLRNERLALRQIRRVLRPGGHAIIEFRNDLFDLFTFNTYTAEFLRERLLDATDLPARVVARAMAKLRRVLAPVDNLRGRSARRRGSLTREEEGFRMIPAKWANPLTIDALFRSAGFTVTDKSFYHYHALPPGFERLAPAAFRRASMRMERDPHDWRGLFMASAFLVCARKDRAR